MPYSSRSDLPDQVKDNLPKDAQKIYKEAFNSAYDQHHSDERASKIAWGAVKKQYHKEGDDWVKDKD